jgi:hypothetical protein
MPSEHALQQALDATAPQREGFRSAVVAAAEQVGGRLSALRAPRDGREIRTALELGSFGSGRIDPNRFGAVFSAEPALDPVSLSRLERAHEALQRIGTAADDFFVRRVPPGGDLRAQVGAALAEIGEAFAAARTAENVRLGRYPSEEADFEREGFPFRRWNRAERQIAPPLIVAVSGRDLQVGGLAEFLDGEQKLVLLVEAPAPPAALVRLITPNVFVLQATGSDELGELRAASGPAVAALLPEGSARFVHRSGGEKIWDRLELRHVPERPRSSVGSVSLFQQTEELGQLRILSTSRPPALPAANGATAPAGAPAVEPADQLAAWLLSQAGLETPEQAGS